MTQATAIDEGPTQNNLYLHIIWFYGDGWEYEYTIIL